MIRLRPLVSLVAWAALGGAGVLVAAVTLSPAVGLRPLTVVSGSMAPAIEAGDVVVTERIAPATARPGDVVTFRDPAGPTRLITHRVQSTSRAASSVHFVTKGDANGTTESWHVGETGTISRVVYRVPMIGRALHAVRSREGRLGLVAVPTLILAAISFRWALRRDPVTPVEAAA